MREADGWLDIADIGKATEILGAFITAMGGQVEKTHMKAQPLKGWPATLTVKLSLFPDRLLSFLAQQERQGSGTEGPGLDIQAGPGPDGSFRLPGGQKLTPFGGQKLTPFGGS